MIKFTKEQLIERAQDEIEDITTPASGYPLMLTDVGRMNLQLMEIALAALTAPEITVADAQRFEREF